MSVYTRLELQDDWNKCLENKKSNDGVIFYNPVNCNFSVMNNEELRYNAKLWRKLAKQGKIIIQKANNKSVRLKNKDYHWLVIQPEPLGDMDCDPFGLCILGEMVSGNIFVFENKTNRDLISDYVMKNIAKY